MFFLQPIIINSVLTKSSGPKRHAVFLTGLIFAGFCVSAIIYVSTLYRIKLIILFSLQFKELWKPILEQIQF